MSKIHGYFVQNYLVSGPGWRAGRPTAQLRSENDPTRACLCCGLCLPTWNAALDKRKVFVCLRLPRVRAPRNALGLCQQQRLTVHCPGNLREAVMSCAELRWPFFCTLVSPVSGTQGHLRISSYTLGSSTILQVRSRRIQALADPTRLPGPAGRTGGINARPVWTPRFDFDLDGARFPDQEG